MCQAVLTSVTLRSLLWGTSAPTREGGQPTHECKVILARAPPREAAGWAEGLLEGSDVTPGEVLGGTGVLRGRMTAAETEL